MTDTTLPSPEAMREFLRAHYRPDRFEVDGCQVWGAEFSRRRVYRHIEALRTIGHSVISRGESASGRPIWFGRRLEAVNGDDFDSYAALMARLMDTTDTTGATK